MYAVYAIVAYAKENLAEKRANRFRHDFAKCQQLIEANLASANRPNDQGFFAEVASLRYPLRIGTSFNRCVLRMTRPINFSSHAGQKTPI